MKRRLIPKAAYSALIVAGLFAVAQGRPHGIDHRPEVGPFFDGIFPEEEPSIPSDIAPLVAFPGLTFINPLGLLPIPGTDRLVVWEREGWVWSFTNDSVTTTKTQVLDLSDRCLGWDDCGLLGLAFHPAFENNGYLFVWYNWIPPETQQGKPAKQPPHQREHRQRLSRFRWNPANGAFDDEYIVIDQEARDTWHSGGGMFFHPGDGFLYLANGDDNNPVNNQRIDGGLFGCVIRIDVDKRSGTVSHPPRRRALGEVGPNWPESYYIPYDNPFSGTEAALGEIYALGLRNPHRMTFDSVTHRIYIADVSEGPGGEINVIEPNDPAGLNFQWNRIDGLRGDLVPPYHGANKRPLLQYRGSDGKAIIGGYVYRGPSLPALRGRYIFGDNFSNRIWAMDESALATSVSTAKVPLGTLPQGPGPRSWRDNTGLSSFGVDANGELYLCQMSSVAGQIYKLALRARSAGPTLPATLSATKLFSNTSALTPSPKLIPFGLNVPFWSDSALKQRWAAIPSGTSVGFKATGEWEWPAGTVMVKHFEMPMEQEGIPDTRRLETRILVKDLSGGFYGITYKWRADHSDADLLDSGFTEVLWDDSPTAESATTTSRNDRQIPNGTGQKRWTYPSRTDCRSCHTNEAGGFLGPKTRQLNGSYHYPNGVIDNQLRSWSIAGLFDRPPAESDLPALDSLAPPTDRTTSLDKRARSYLDANCAYCHRPEVTRTFWDARFDSPPAIQGILHGHLANRMGNPMSRVVVPGDPVSSMIHLRMESTDEAIGMPPLAKNEVDRKGLALVKEWITSLPNYPPPKVSLGAPASATIGEVIRLTATVGEKDAVTRVEFFNGPDLIGEVTTPPYEMIWTGALHGGHSLVAVVTDDTGNAGVSEARTIRIEAPSPPPPWAELKSGKTAAFIALHIAAVLLAMFLFRKKKEPAASTGK